MVSGLLSLLVVLLVVGVVVYAIQALAIPQPFKGIALAIVLLILILWLLQFLGVWAGPPLHR